MGKAPHILSGESVRLGVSLKCLHIKAHSKGLEKEKLEGCMQFRAAVSLGGRASIPGVLQWVDRSYLGRTI